MSPGIENRRTAYMLAASQHGVVARRQLIAAGLPERTVDRWGSNGVLIGVFRAVYALGRPATRDESLMMAALLAAGEGALLTGRAAAAAWGFGDRPDEIEVIRPAGITRRLRGIAPHETVGAWIHRGAVTLDERCRIGPLALASPDRVLADLAGQTTDRDLRRYFLDAGRFGHLSSGCLTRICESERRYRGRSGLVRMAGLWDPDKGSLRSHMEAEFRLMCAEQSVPLPETNRKIGRDEVDGVWWEARVVVELDSRRFHSDPFAQRDDAEKSRRLRAAGFMVLRFTWEEITGSPEVVARKILEALGRRAPSLLQGRAA